MHGEPRQCILLLGGSFDPVHRAHVALAQYLIDLLRPDLLHIIPAKNPWQKNGLQASAEDRVAMLERAFADFQIPLAIDRQEILRDRPSYSVETLRAIRAELGPEVSLVFLIGADQLRYLDTWRHWRELFKHSHVCAASRPGFSMDAAHMPAAVAEEFARRAATPELIRHTAAGLALLATDLAIDISATAIRTALQGGYQAIHQLPTGVLDYIEQHHLYRH